MGCHTLNKITDKMLENSKNESQAKAGTMDFGTLDSFFS